MFSPGQRLLLRNGKFAQFVRPVDRLGGEIIEVRMSDRSTRFVNVRDVRATDWSGYERRTHIERRQGERRKVNRPIDAKLDLRKQPDRRQRDRRQFAITRKPEPRPSRQ